MLSNRALGMDLSNRQLVVMLCIFIYMQGGYPTLLGEKKMFAFMNANGLKVFRRVVHKEILVGSSSLRAWRLALGFVLCVGVGAWIDNCGLG
jgi:hypothetical protein